MINIRKMRLAGSIARMGEKRNAYRISLENLKRKDSLENPDFYERLILKWILRKENERVYTEFI
jgi:hypothetical protein